MEEDIDLIRDRFLDHLSTLGVDQVVMDNQANVSIDESRPWVRFQINPGDGEQIGLRDGIRVHRLGFTILQVFVPNGSGTKSAYVVAQAFLAMWFRWRDLSDTGSIRTLVGYTRPVPNTEFFQVNVFVPYESMRTFASIS